MLAVWDYEVAVILLKLPLIIWWKLLGDRGGKLFFASKQRNNGPIFLFPHFQLQIPITLKT